METERAGLIKTTNYKTLLFAKRKVKSLDGFSIDKNLGTQDLFSILIFHLISKPWSSIRLKAIPVMEGSKYSSGFSSDFS